MNITDAGNKQTNEEKPPPPLAGVDPNSIQTPMFSDEQVLAVTQANGMNLMKFAIGEVRSGSPRSIEVAMAVLNQMASTAQSNIKQRDTNATAGQISGAANFIATVLGNIGNRDAIPIVNHGNEAPPAPNIDHIEAPMLVPGETHQGVENLKPKDFLPE